MRLGRTSRDTGSRRGRGLPVSTATGTVRDKRSSWSTVSIAGGVLRSKEGFVSTGQIQCVLALEAKLFQVVEPVFLQTHVESGWRQVETLLRILEA